MIILFRMFGMFSNVLGLLYFVDFPTTSGQHLCVSMIFNVYLVDQFPFHGSKFVFFCLLDNM